MPGTASSEWYGLGSDSMDVVCVTGVELLDYDTTHWFIYLWVVIVAEQWIAQRNCEA
jgi:hypothetical protein